MKTINTKELGKILEENVETIDTIENLDEFEQISPCWEAKVDRDRKKILFMKDGEEKVVASLSKFAQEEISIGFLTTGIKLLRESKISELKKLARITK